MKHLIIILFCAISVTVFAKEYVGEGYLVYIDTENLTEVKHTVFIQEVVFTVSGYTTANVRKELKNSRYFEILSDKYHVYVERKRVFKKRNGKLVYRKWKR